MSRTGARDRARHHLAMAMDYVDKLEAALKEIATFAQNATATSAPGPALSVIADKACEAFLAERITPAESASTAQPLSSSNRSTDR